MFPPRQKIPPVRLLNHTIDSHKIKLRNRLGELGLAPDIQAEILFLPRTTQGRDPIKEADIRPIAKSLDWNKQRQMWKQLVRSVRELSGVVASVNGE